ncbi:MAG TPA: DUF6456 domain-containing protein [Terricaulis sp.]|nr:DUF6456 domain-containing protein [Terricaulis sp.]
MSARAVERALARLHAPEALLVRAGEGYGVLPGGDRRRRLAARLDAASVRALESEGVLTRVGPEAYALSEAGRARLRREGAQPGEAFAAQHAQIVDRFVMDGAGDARAVRGVDSGGALRRLAALRDAGGKPWLSGAELAAAEALRADWERAQAGLVRGSDWRAPPNGASARAANGQEQAMAARCDAGRRSAQKLARLAPALRRVVERACLYEDGLEALERAEGWPARSGKVALKLGLAQLAAG